MKLKQHSPLVPDKFSDNRQKAAVEPNTGRLPNDHDVHLVRAHRLGGVTRLAVRGAVIVGLALAAVSVLTKVRLRLKVAERNPLPISIVAVKTPLRYLDGAALLMHAGKLISINEIGANSRFVSWFTNPNYQTLSMVNPIPYPAGTGTTTTAAANNALFTQQKIALFSAMLAKNKKALADIHRGMREGCIMEGVPGEYIANRCSGLLLLHAYLQLLKKNYDGALHDAFDTLNLDSLLSRDANVRNYGQLLQLNGLARSLIVYVLQLEDPGFPQFGAGKQLLSRHQVVRLQNQMNAYMQHRVSLVDVLNAQTERYAHKLAGLLATYYTPHALAIEKAKGETSPTILQRLEATHDVLTYSRKEFLTRYEEAMKSYIASVAGQYRPLKRYPLSSWQRWLSRRSTSISVKLRPPIPLTVDEHADIAWDRMVQVTLAELLYEFDHKTLPPTLQALVPEYLPAVPIDPFARQPAPLLYYVTPPNQLQYNPTNSVGLVYSVGPDGVDDNGQPYEEYQPLGRYNGLQSQSLNPSTKGDLVVNYEDEQAWNQ